VNIRDGAENRGLTFKRFDEEASAATAGERLPIFWLVANFRLVDPGEIRELLQYFYNLFQVAFRYGQILPRRHL
jgi:hypothetical protein